MQKSLEKFAQGYSSFKEKYLTGNQNLMHDLATHGQKPEAMVIACCDSRVDPAIIFQCDPGDIFTVRNIANIVPPYKSSDVYDATSAALEYGICYLNVKHLIILGHSQCGGIQALINKDSLEQNDFITDWASVIGLKPNTQDGDAVAKQALAQSYKNCLTFPWIKERVSQNKLEIHTWFFDIKSGKLATE